MIQKKIPNPFRIAAVLAALFALLFFWLYHHNTLSLITTFNVVGAMCNLSGTLWIASGVYLLKSDLMHLNNGNPARNKYSLKLASLLTSGSSAIPIGTVYIIVGSAFQIFSTIGAELKWM